MKSNSELLLPTQSKAARALLGWTQQELAQKANVATSTIADFERDKRSPVTNNLDAIRTAFEDAGLSFPSGGAVIGIPTAVTTNPIAKSGTPIRWINSTDLVQWADRRDAQALFPELMSRLILATTGNTAQRLEFRAEDSIQQAGWDGVSVIDIEQTLSFLPKGSSGWELSTQKDKISAKATDDFTKRSNDPIDLDPLKSTFVFVTLRRWSGGAKWAQKHKTKNSWADVRVLDADALVHWIDLFPSVGYWLAAHLGKRPASILQITELWEEWSASTRWRMTPEIILAGRDREAAEVLRWLYGAPTCLSVQAESPHDAVAFLYAAISQLPEKYRTYYHSKCLRVASTEAARALGNGPSALVLILDNLESGLATRLVELGHHVYQAFGSVVGTPDQIKLLPRASREAFTESLQNMGLPSQDAVRYARDSARSFSVLRRLIPSAPSSAVPEWANPTIARTLLPALFAGAWSSTEPGDRSVLEQLSGENYEKVDEICTQWASRTDSVLRRVGHTWKVASPLDAWLRLAAYISESDLNRFELVAHAVLGTPDPRFDIASDKRWLAAVHDRKPKYSALLLSGVSETLLLLALHGDKVQSVSGASHSADRVVARLLVDADERRWWSVSGILETLAEAAPEVFLDEVEKSLAGPDRALNTLFVKEDGPFGTAHHTNLLWALEILAWSPDYLTRSTELLAKLASIDPGGRSANRPKNSLRSIFLLWYPQTNATLDQRMRVLDRLRMVQPDAAWELMLGVIPSGRDFASPAPKPRWRDFSVEKDELITDALIFRGASAIVQRLLADVGFDHNKWGQLIAQVPNMAPDSRKTTLAKLEEAILTLEDDNARTVIWSALRVLLHNHRSFPTEAWALPREELDQIERLYDASGPRDLSSKVGWLFAQEGVTLPSPTEADWERHDEKVAQLRQRAVLDVFKNSGTAGLLRLAESVTGPQYVGEAFGKFAANSTDIDIVFVNALKHTSSAVSRFVHALVSASHIRMGNAWSLALLDRIRHDASLSEHAPQVLLALPETRDTWDLVASFGKAVDEAYWRQIGLHWTISNSQDARYALERLIEVGCAHNAVQLYRSTSKNFDSQLWIRVLTEAVHQSQSELDQRNNAVMFPWSVEQILQRLDKAPDVTESQIAELEWKYLALLRRSKRPLFVLHRSMSTNPDFFLTVICAAYKPAPGSGAEDHEKDKVTPHVATHAFHLLDSWKTLPGLSNGSIDAIALNAWVIQAHSLCHQVSRGGVGDRYIGRILANSPVDPDGSWPSVAIRDLIEKMRNSEIEFGIDLGVHNNRGVTVSGILDGGVQERSTARTYRDWSDATKLEWPRTSALLRRISRSFEEIARYHDENAERNDW